MRKLRHRESKTPTHGSAQSSTSKPPCPRTQGRPGTRGKWSCGCTWHIGDVARYHLPQGGTHSHTEAVPPARQLTVHDGVSPLKPPALEQRASWGPPMPTEPVGLGTEVLLHLHRHPFLLLLQGGTSGNAAKGLQHPLGGLALPPGLGPYGGQLPTSPPAPGPSCAVASSCTTPLAWVGVRRRSRHSLPGHESGGSREPSPMGHRGKGGGTLPQGLPCRGASPWAKHCPLRRGKTIPSLQVLGLGVGQVVTNSSSPK